MLVADSFEVRGLAEGGGAVRCARKMNEGAWRCGRCVRESERGLS